MQHGEQVQQNITNQNAFASLTVTVLFIAVVDILRYVAVAGSVRDFSQRGPLSQQQSYLEGSVLHHC